MTKLNTFIFAISSLLAGMSNAMVTIHTLDFEAGDEVGYNLYDDANGVTGRDHFVTSSDRLQRTTSTVGSYDVTPTGNATNFIALEDIDASTGVGFDDEEGYLLITGINILNANSLSVAIDVSFSNDTATRYESTDVLEIDARIDGGSYATVMRFIGRSGTGNGQFMGLDSNLNGSLDGAEASDSNLYNAAFSTVSGNIAGAGSVMDLRVRFVSGTQEEMNFDNIVVSAVSVPEPSTTLLFSVAMLAGLTRRKR